MTGRRLLVLWLAAALLFAVLPGLDIAVSRLFFDAGTARFPLARSEFLEGLRNLIWGLAHLLALAALAFALHAGLTRRDTVLPARIWTFALLLILLGPVLIVNGLFKSFWGRARPAEIAEFGGTAPFTPPWQLSPACADNCSFVSGEAAAVACVAILLWLFLRNALPPERRKILALALVTLVVVGAGLRVMTGRHFLSDVIWAVLMMTTLAWWLARRLRLVEIECFVTLPALRADAAALWADLRGALRRVLGDGEGGRS